MFEKLKKKLKKAPILAYPQWDQPFILQVDASKLGMGGVLTQVINNREHAIVYFSKKFSASEQNYATTEQECLAMVEAIKHFRPYLYGHAFTIITDHKPLEHIDSFKSHNGRVARWRMTLSDYNFTVIACAGRLNANADALSRLPVLNMVEFKDKFIKTDDPAKLREYQLADPDVKQIIDYLEQNELPNDKRENSKLTNESEHYYMKEGVLYHLYWPTRKHRITTRLRLVVPLDMRQHIMWYFHNDPLSAHQGIQRTYELISSRFYWTGMCHDIEDHVCSCVTCIAKKSPRLKKAGLLQSIPVVGLWHTVGVDILGPLPMTPRKFRYVLVFSDYYSKFPICVPVKDITATTVAEAMLHEVFLRYGKPRRLLSDHGSQFLSKMVQEMCKMRNIAKIQSTSYHPQTDGLVERFNHTLCVMLSMYCHDKPSEWDFSSDIRVQVMR